MIITIARQCGCGAINVGKLLAEALWYSFLYPKEFASRWQARKVCSTRWRLSLMSVQSMNLLFAMSSFGESQQLLTESHCVHLADMIGEENCIIIGRCGNYIFRERKDLVSRIPEGND